jgi:hypothetical protein
MALMVAVTTAFKRRLELLIEVAKELTSIFLAAATGEISKAATISHSNTHPMSLGGFQEVPNGANVSNLMACPITQVAACNNIDGAIKTSVFACCGSRQEAPSRTRRSLQRFKRIQGIQQ